MNSLLIANKTASNRSCPQLPIAGDTMLPITFLSQKIEQTFVSLFTFTWLSMEPLIVAS
ncbi:hypothetical protein THF1D04_370006 [Vibrio owensii]|uniref:Uncharacterized protein n=1 Tax=Vibrio owensii TaxID=696485 RepID=A0AAU9Q7S8_9VIBR|nr:hypothetical protein THF1D04_370006 [Vibrio owensii]